MLILCITSGIIQFAYPSKGVQGGIVDYGKIQAADGNYDIINQSLGEFSSDTTLIFMNSEDNWIKTSYYFPNYQAYSYYSRVSSGKTYYGLRHYKDNKKEVSEAEILEVHINSSTTKILWLIDNYVFLKDLQSRIEVKSIGLADGGKIYYSNVRNDTDFKIYNFAFMTDD